MPELQVSELDCLMRKHAVTHSPQEKAELANKILDKVQRNGLPMRDFLEYLNPISHPAP